MALDVAAVGIDVDNRTITISLQSEPPNLDSSLSQDTTSAQILALTNEALVGIGERGKIMPGVAERWELGDREATFYLRDSAVWADGRPVTAHDFVYAWRRLVDPATGASGSAFFAYVLENAQAILAGELPITALGVRAESDRVLKVQLSRPVPYLLTVLSGTGYLPLREDFVEAQKGRFGAEAQNMLSNGPFVMNSWIHNSAIKFTKNPTYWNREQINLAQLNVGYITSDVRSLLNVYKSQELAALRLNEEILGDAAQAGFRIRKAPTNCLAWLVMNVRPGRPTANLKLRQAIRLAFDRDRYVNKIVGLPGTRKIESVFTRRIKGVSGSFQKEYPAPAIGFDPAAARGLIEEARRELGVSVLPPIVLLANETRQIEAEFIQAQLGSALGLDVKVDKQTFKQAIAKMNKGDFDIARAGFCGGAIMDPVFFAGIFVSNGPFNNGGYDNPEYNRLMDLTHATGEPLLRMDAFGKLQQLLFDDVTIIPTHESSYVYLEDVRLKGIMRYPVVDFSGGYVTP